MTAPSLLRRGPAKGPGTVTARAVLSISRMLLRRGPAKGPGTWRTTSRPVSGWCFYEEVPLRDLERASTRRVSRPRCGFYEEVPLRDLERPPCHRRAADPTRFYGEVPPRDLEQLAKLWLNLQGKSEELRGVRRFGVNESRVIGQRDLNCHKLQVFSTARGPRAWPGRD